MSNKSIQTAIITIIVVLLIANGSAIFWYVQRQNSVELPEPTQYAIETPVEITSEPTQYVTETPVEITPEQTETATAVPESVRLFSTCGVAYIAHPNSFKLASLYPGGVIYITRGSNSQILFWDEATRTTSEFADFPFETSDTHFWYVSAEENRILVLVDRTLHKWENGAWSELFTLNSDFSISSNSMATRLALVTRDDLTGDNPQEVAQLFLWDEQTGFRQLTDFSHWTSLEVSAATIKMSSDGQRIIVIAGENLTNDEAHVNKEMYLWDAESGFQRLTNSMDMGGSVAYQGMGVQHFHSNPDATHIYFGYYSYWQAEDNTVNQSISSRAFLWREGHDLLEVDMLDTGVIVFPDGNGWIGDENVWTINGLTFQPLTYTNPSYDGTSLKSVRRLQFNFERNRDLFISSFSFTGSDLFAGDEQLYYGYCDNRPQLVSVDWTSNIVTGSVITLSAEAASTTPVTYQWYMGETGDTTQPIGNTASITSPTLDEDTNFWVRLTNENGVTDSSSLFVNVSGAPEFVYLDTEVEAGLTIAPNVTFELSGDGPFTYTWYSGESGDTSQIVSENRIVPVFHTDTTFWLRVTSPYGSIDSETIHVRMIEPPVFNGFTVEPEPIIPGEPVTVTVDVSGEGVSIEWFETDDNNERTLVAQGQQLVLEETNEPRQFTVVISNSAGEVREYYDYIPVAVFNPSSENTAAVQCELRPLTDADPALNRGAIYVELSGDASRAAIVYQEADAGFNFVTQIDLVDTTTREVIAQFENVYDFVLPVLSDDGTAMTYIELVDKETFSTSVMHWQNGTLTRIADAVPQVSYEAIDMSGDGQTVVLGSNMLFEGNEITATTDLYYYRWDVANGLSLINETPVVLPLPPDTMLPITPIRISDDAEHIVFGHTANLTGENPDGNVALFMSNADGTLTQVTNKFIPAQATLGFFVVNRDGSSVAFPSDENFVGHNADGSVEIFVWNANADMEQITDTEGEHKVAVLGIVDTSSSVTFLSDADFAGKNPDGNLEFYRWDLQTGFRTLWSPEDGYTQYAVSTGQNMLVADISSDGHSLAFPFFADISPLPVAFLANCGV